MASTVRNRRGDYSAHPGVDGKDQRLVLARIAVMFFFLLDGTVFGSWFSRIPAVQEALGLGNDALGIALLGAAAGALLTQPVAGWLIDRWGSRRITIVGAVAQCAALTLPAMASGLGTLIVSLVLLGCATGILDVAMNVQGVTVERRYQRFIMTTFHACYSVGGLLGAVTGGLVASQGIGIAPHLFTVAACSAAGIFVAGRRLLPASVDAGSRGQAFPRPSRTLVRLGIVAFCVVLAEGAMGDWSAVYLRQDLALNAGMAAGGYAMFSLTMTVGRLAGGWWTRSFGPVTVMRLGGIAVATGLLVALTASGPVLALTGFACIGIGLSCAFPVALSAAGRIHEGHPGAAIASINAAGYIGFLAGPPLIGFVSQGFGLDAALGMLALVGIMMVVLSGTVGSGRVEGETAVQRMALA